MIWVFNQNYPSSSWWEFTKSVAVSVCQSTKYTTPSLLQNAIFNIMHQRFIQVIIKSVFIVSFIDIWRQRDKLLTRWRHIITFYKVVVGDVLTNSLHFTFEAL